MDIEIKGITEEEYGLWVNYKQTNSLEEKEQNDVTITKIGFNLEDVKNFKLDLENIHHIIFVKVHNDKTYDIYREHLITLIKMMILKRNYYDTKIIIVSDKYQDYKDELTNFFYLNTHYEKKSGYGKNISLIKCFSMRFIGFKITNLIIKTSYSLQKLMKKMVK